MYVSLCTTEPDQSTCHAARVMSRVCDVRVGVLFQAHEKEKPMLRIEGDRGITISQAKNFGRSDVVVAGRKIGSEKE